ncbi:FAD-dependent monooxygenase [Meridianimarinicoccus sp. MJW13]|uniref:FAD-dependent monooxygenase n=1 Tax=Meridianimarinicoccus sp. MJW13 TaxID=2720031 RepID=UPI001867B212|nr:FAD-dependent monooxygenase [Fluviibacterium sp. MJW13]
MNRIYDAVIVGGSLTGASLALALARAGLTVAVIDALPKDTQTERDFDGRSYALALASVRMLKALDLWAPLAGDAQPMLHIKVTDGRAGEGPSRFGLHFDCGELEEGPMGHMVEDRHLRRALLAALETTPGITHLPATRVTEQATDGSLAQVTLDSGKTLQAHLLVGADGRTGPVAARAGIARKVTDYRQTALVCAISHEKPHNGTAHQFFMPPGPLAILPLKGNRSSIVWSESAEQAAAIHALNDADYLSVLRPRFGDFLGEIALEGRRYTYPLTLVLADHFTAHRLALVGDSAHGMHPIAGQGFNAGLRDVAALAEVLADARRRGEDIGRADVLDRYAQWRRFDTAALAFTTDTLNRLFSNDNPLLRLGRDLGLGLVGATPPLRRAFMREAAGLTGNLPRLLRGEPV